MHVKMKEWLSSKYSVHCAKHPNMDGTTDLDIHSFFIYLKEHFLEGIAPLRASLCEYREVSKNK